MVEGFGAGPAGRWSGAPRDPECLVAHDAEGRFGVGRMGRRSGGGAVDGVPGVWGQADFGGTVSKHEGLGGVHATGSWGKIHLEQRFYIWRLAGVCDDGFGLPRGDDGQGFYRDGVFRAVDGAAGKDRGGVGEKRGSGGIRWAGREDQERVSEGVCDGEWKAVTEYADGVCASAGVWAFARGGAAVGSSPPGGGCAEIQAFDDRISGDAGAVRGAERVRVSGRSLHAVEP